MISKKASKCSKSVAAFTQQKTIFLGQVMLPGSKKSNKTKAFSKDNQKPQERQKGTKSSVVIYEGKVEIRFNPLDISDRQVCV